MGGQMAGLIGRQVTSGKVGVIVALDPARVGFENNATRIAPTDA